LRHDYELVNLFPVYFSGEFLFGLTEPHIMRLIESLPGVEMLNNYAFKYGKMQLLDMPLTINPSGCARSEPKLRTHFRPFHTLTCTTSSTSSATHPRNSSLPRALETLDNPQIPYVKQFVLSKSTQYKKLKAEWRNIVYLAKSRIQVW
jgi:histone-lysine N-methyltransferase MLL3